MTDVILLPLFIHTCHRLKQAYRTGSRAPDVVNNAPETRERLCSLAVVLHQLLTRLGARTVAEVGGPVGHI